jgi:hypothetical protein
VWITRAPGMAPSEKTQTYERGTYYFFDVNSWRYPFFVLDFSYLYISFVGLSGPLSPFSAED